MPGDNSRFFLEKYWTIYMNHGEKYEALKIENLERGVKRPNGPYGVFLSSYKI